MGRLISCSCQVNDVAGLSNVGCMCRELSDAEEFEGLVQRNMEAKCSFNYFTMAHFVGTILVRQMERLCTCRPEASLHEVLSLHRCMDILEQILSELSAAYDIPIADCSVLQKSLLGKECSAGLAGLSHRLDNLLDLDTAKHSFIDTISSVLQMGRLFLDRFKC